MATLGANINATVTEFAVTGGTTAVKGHEYRIDDELVEFRGFGQVNTSRPRWTDDTGRWRVHRAVSGSEAASHTAGAEIVGTNEAVVTGEDLAQPDPFSAGAEGGGASPLEDPVNRWEQAIVVAEGYRLAEEIEGELRVFEAVQAGTTHASATGISDFQYDLTPLGVTEGGDVDWRYIGIVGHLPWTVLPPQLPPGIAIGGDGEVVLTSPSEPGDGDDLFVIQATVSDTPVSVFESRTDGDADWWLDTNAGAGFRFNRAADGVQDPAGYITEVTTERLRVAASGAESFEVIYDLLGNGFAVLIQGLPTSDPVVPGQLWLDVAGGRVIKVSAGP